MAQRPLSPEGGEASFLRVRMAREEYEHLDAELALMDINRSEFLRRCVRYGLKNRDAVLALGDRKEVATKAS